MRLLLLLPFAPRLDAVHGGGRVIAQFLTEITARHQVAIICFREDGESGTDAFFRERCELVEEIVRPMSRKSLGARLLRYLGLLFSLIRLRPLWVMDWSSPSFAKQARAIARRFQPDIIQAELHVMGQYFSALRDTEARRVLVEHEPGRRAAPYIQTVPAVLSLIIQRMERISWWRYESWLYRQVEAIVVFTEADRRSVEEAAGQTPIHIIPPGTVIPEGPLNPLGSHPLSLLFVGNFFHPPNVDAAQRLIVSIFPAVQRQIPEIRLLIVGDHPPAQLKQIKRENILVTGRVADITPYLEEAALFVAPMYLGGGMRVKVLEALAAGKAVVTTPLAAEGLDLVDGGQVSLAANDQDFVERIVHLLKSEEERLDLARHARAWACEHMGWDQAMQRYELLYQGLLGDPTHRESMTEPLSVTREIKAD